MDDSSLYIDNPGGDFKAAAPALEDVYFHQIASKMDMVTI